VQVWIVVGVWVLAIVVGVVVLGFAAYEVVWKAQRLDRDRRRLAGVVTDLASVSQELQAAAVRAQQLRTQQQG
jgi:hypothetical protein